MATHILITGGAGYFGSVLSKRLLDAGYTVTVLDNLMYGQIPLLHLCTYENFNFVRGDARDTRILNELIPKADVLIPLACIVGAPACDNDRNLATGVNLEAIVSLNNIRSPDQLVVYPTTNSGYGTKTGETFCTEETQLEPISLYGVTKSEAERTLLESPNAITLRLATVFGISPRMRLDLLVNHFVYAAVTDGYLVIFEKDFKRNYIHIEDVADCFVHCIEHSPDMIGRTFNVGLEEANLSKEELALKVKQYVPRLFIHFAAIGSDPDKRNYIVSNERLKKAGFVAKRSLDQGITELLKGYLMLPRSPYKNI